MAVHDEPRTGVVAFCETADVGHGWLGSDDFWDDKMGVQVFCHDFCCGAGVSWGVGGWGAGEGLEEGDVIFFVALYYFEEGLGVHFGM